MAAALAIRRFNARIPAQAQPVAARLALQALGADLEEALPSGLPPQALLWLRRLQLQAPEAALLRPAPAAWRQGWVHAGRERLSAALAKAARPALGPVPDSAEAVLFADTAEMLACLALAAHAGQLQRWWWRGLLGKAWPQWQAGWAQRPEAQAAALRLLARQGQGGMAEAAFAGAAAAGLGIVARPGVVEAAAASQGRPGEAGNDSAQVAQLVVEHQREDAPEPPATAAPLSSEATAPAAPDGGLHSMAPPDPAQPADDSALAAVSVPGSEARSFAGGAASAPAAPAVAFAAVSIEAPAVSMPGLEPAPPAPVPQRVSARMQGAASAAEAAEVPAGPVRPPAEAAVAPPPVVGAGPPLALLLPNSPADRLPRSVAQAQPATSEVSEKLAAPPAEAPDVVRRAPPPASAPQHAAPADVALPDGAQAWPWPQALATRQAPLLFIVNALLEDGLYPDFTQPRDPGLPVPLWALLLALAQAWRLPPDPLQALLARHAPDTLARTHMPAVPGVPAGEWAGWLPAYARCLRQRLCRRLGQRGSQWRQALSLARPEQLWVSEAEWVVEFDLGAHDVAWRLAGLDRDPGWLPSTGVSLRFRFG